MPGSPLVPGDLLTLTQVAARLGVHYMTAYRYLRTGRLEGAKHGAEWRVRGADLARFEADALLASSTSSGRPGSRGGPATNRADVSRSEDAAPIDGAIVPSHPRRRTDWSGRAEERLLSGDEPGAWSVIDSAMSAGMTIEEVYLELLTPALSSIGDRWANGDITVADEHLAAAMTMRLVGRLGPRFARRGRKRGTIVTAAPHGERHALPVALLADLLRGRGFRVLDLGGDVPSDSLASMVAGADNLLAVSLGATTPGNEASIIEAIAAVRTVTTAPVLLGGQAVGDPGVARALGADGGGSNTIDGLELFGRLSRPVPQPT